MRLPTTAISSILPLNPSSLPTTTTQSADDDDIEELPLALFVPPLKRSSAFLYATVRRPHSASSVSGKLVREITSARVKRRRCAHTHRHQQFHRTTHSHPRFRLWLCSPSKASFLPLSLHHLEALPLHKQWRKRKKVFASSIARMAAGRGVHQVRQKAMVKAGQIRQIRHPQK